MPSSKKRAKGKERKAKAAAAQQGVPFTQNTKGNDAKEVFKMHLTKEQKEKMDEEDDDDSNYRIYFNGPLRVVMTDSGKTYLDMVSGICV